MSKDVVIVEEIGSKIYVIRGHKVMLDRDLATLYGVEVKVLNQAVKRNAARFPADFMFQLTKEETETYIVRSQIVTLEPGQHLKYLPYAFTEHGIAMLSSVLNSERAAQVNIQIVRAFIKLREFLTLRKDLTKRIDDMGKKYDRQFQQVFEAIKKMIEEPANLKRQIGFKAKNEE